MAFKLPDPVIIENPELAVPAIVGYKAYESYQGINQLIDRWSGGSGAPNRNDSKIETVPSLQNSSGGTYLLPRRPAPVQAIQDSKGGTFIASPPRSIYDDAIRANEEKLAQIRDNLKRSQDEKAQALRDQVMRESKMRDDLREIRQRNTPISNGTIDLTNTFDDQGVDLFAPLLGGFTPITPIAVTASDRDYNEDIDPLVEEANRRAMNQINNDTSLDDMDLSDQPYQPLQPNRSNPFGLIPFAVGGAGVLAGGFTNTTNPPLVNVLPTPPPTSAPTIRPARPGENPNLDPTLAPAPTVGPLPVKPPFTISSDGNSPTRVVVVREVPIVQTIPTLPVFVLGVTGGMILASATDLLGWVLS